MKRRRTKMEEDALALLQTIPRWMHGRNDLPWLGKSDNPHETRKGVMLADKTFLSPEDAEDLGIAFIRAAAAARQDQ